MTSAKGSSGSDPAHRGLLPLLVAWPGKVAEELVLAPWTVARVRRSLTELPDRIDALTVALDHTTSNLDGTVSALAADMTELARSLDQVLPAISALVTGMDGRVEHLEAMVSELGQTVIGVVTSIPGMGRRLKPG